MGYDIEKLVNIQGFIPSGIEFLEGEVKKVIVRLKRKDSKYVCSGCGRIFSSFYDSRMHLARDLPYGVWLESWVEFERKRVECPRCGVTVEKLDWINTRRHYTKHLAEETARACQLQSLQQVAKRFHLKWDMVKDIDKESLNAKLNPPNFEGVEYLAMDMWPAYEAATKEYCPQAEIVYDQFHIVRDYGLVISSVRSQEAQKAPEKNKSVFMGTKYLLLANRGRYRKKDDRKRLQHLLDINKRLSTVYILKDELKELWRFTYEGAAKRWFDGWYRKAIYSKIAPLKAFAKSLKRHLSGILAHCRHKLNTSFLEGMNNKIKVIKRIAYGFRDQDYFFLKIRGAFAK